MARNLVSLLEKSHQVRSARTTDGNNWDFVVVSGSSHNTYEVKRIKSRNGSFYWKCSCEWNVRTARACSHIVAAHKLFSEIILETPVTNYCVGGERKGESLGTRPDDIWAW